MKFPVIPRRIKISKRLAQCMHPALPSGVHLKALETYDIIFKCMGTNRLSHELFIYSAGLFPLLGHAAMNVRPSLLTVYESHFVPLGERLRPGLSGFLSGVLPGLEEGSDHYNRTNSLLEKVCVEVGLSHFYGCLWDCLACNCSIRLPAISFVLSHFNKKLTMEDQLYMMGTNIDIMVNALCACVQDSSVLVQRSALDLLLVGFPMHNSQLVRSDMIRLVTTSLATILRRDMSLNRYVTKQVSQHFPCDYPQVRYVTKQVSHHLPCDYPQVRYVTKQMSQHFPHDYPQVRHVTKQVRHVTKQMSQHFPREYPQVRHVTKQMSQHFPHDYPQVRHVTNQMSQHFPCDYPQVRYVTKQVSHHLPCDYPQVRYVTKQMSQHFPHDYPQVRHVTKQVRHVTKQMSQHFPCDYPQVRHVTKQMSQHFSYDYPQVRHVTKQMSQHFPRDYPQVRHVTKQTSQHFPCDYPQVRHVTKQMSQHFPHYYPQVRHVTKQMSQHFPHYYPQVRHVTKQMSHHFPRDYPQVRHVTKQVSHHLPCDYPQVSHMRLFAWLLGSEVNISLLSSEHPLVKMVPSLEPSNSSPYFHLYSKDMLIQALKITLSQSVGQAPHDLRPYRLLVSLLDKPDIGPVILDDILYEVFRTLYLCCEEDSSRSTNKTSSTPYKGSQELLKSANLFFSTLEPFYIWVYAGSLFDSACPQRSGRETEPAKAVKPVGSAPPTLIEVCALTEFLLDTVSLETYVDITSEHLPSLFLHIIKHLTAHCDFLSPCEAARSLQLCTKILSRVRPSPLANPPEAAKKVSMDTNSESKISSLLSDISKSSTDVTSDIFDRSRANSDPFTNKKTLKGSKIPVKLKKSSSSKFRIKQFGLSKNYKAHSFSTPVLLSVIPNSLEKTPSQEKLNDKDSGLGSVDSKLSLLSRAKSSVDVSNGHATQVPPELEVPFTDMNSLQVHPFSPNISVEVPVCPSPIPTKQQSILEQCLREYEQFYVTFIGGKCVMGNLDVHDLFNRLLIGKPLQTDEERTSKLERLLSACLNCRGGKRVSIPSIRVNGKNTSNISVEWVNDCAIKVIRSEDWEESVKMACSLLVELSTFPSYCLPSVQQDDPDKQMDVVGSFPEWLQVLVACACWLGGSPALQLITISTLLDLVSLLLSQGPASGITDVADSPGVVPVVLVPLLKPHHVYHLEHSMNVVQVLAHSLWHHLGQLPSQHQVHCVELLHHLHNVLPANDAVENILGEFLMNEIADQKMEAFQRFSLLWHVGREMESKAGMGRSFRTFDKQMIDNLQLSECCPLKLQTQSWLLHSLLRGDISRLVDPLLYMLLDPATARMSVLHVSIAHSNTVVTRVTKESEDPDDTAMAKIYAISSVDGNVIYHVSDSSAERKPQVQPRLKGSKTSNPVRAKRIFAVTTLVSRGDNNNHYITEKNNHIKEIEVPLSLTFGSKHNISVFVNPLVTSSSSNANSNDSATEDDSITNSGKGDIIKTPEFLNATRFVTSRKEVDSIRGDADSSLDCSLANEGGEFLKCPVKCESSITTLRKNSGFEEGDLEGDNFTDTSGVDKRWSGCSETFEDLEVSSTAEDYFAVSRDSSITVVKEILHDVLDMVVIQCSDNQPKQLSPAPPPSLARMKPGQSSSGIHPLHTHMLLYCGVYDSQRTLYALRTLRAQLLTNTRVFLCSAATTGLATSSRGSSLLTLLARHRKSVFGRNFHGDVSSSGGEFVATYRSSMYLEVLISLCLYFARSYYPNLGQMRLTQEEIEGNRQVQLSSAELLMLIISELILIVRDSGKGFACYIADLLSRCKVQKVVLHCVLSSVHSMKASASDTTVVTTPNEPSSSRQTFTEEIVRFNDPLDERVRGCRFRASEHTEGYQVQLLRLLLALIMLEHQVNTQKGEDDTGPPVANTPAKPTTGYHLKFNAGLNIPQQPMFLAAILSALRQEHMKPLHQHWTTLVASSLPFMDLSLPHVVLHVIKQLCVNVEKLAAFYRQPEHKASCTLCCIPADYAVTQVEALTVLCHYCLLDNTQQVSHAFSQQLLAGTASIHMGIPGANPGQIFNNLIHVFMPTPLQQDLANGKDKTGQLDPHVTSRRTVLSHLPRIIASVAVLWQAVTSRAEWEHHSCVLGSARIVKHQLLEFLSPISLHHGANFVAAIAVAWQERRQAHYTKVVPVANTDQQVLVYLVGAIRAMPIDTLVQTVHQVVKQPPPIHGAIKDLLLEVSVLELFYCYMQTNSGPQLVESWVSLLILLKDGLTLTPPAQFLMLAILNEFVQKSPPLAEKKDQKDLQDITAKLVESCSQIAGACLEQTTWLRRNLAVREEEPSPAPIPRDKDGTGVANLSLAQYSVQAQIVLAELLAPLLDVSYGSQEKERVVTLLTTLMYNITPYLKNHTHKETPNSLYRLIVVHSRRNVGSFRACSQLLASLSSYQYTRKAWRRDVFELLLDSALFQMEADCLTYWRTIVDNLMTHDTTTFRDLMSRVSLAQSGSLSIFSSREQEYEQRAQLLKRLAFVIFCSEIDQYHKYMPEIQERLADSLRLPQVVPSIQAQVFLCFSVLLLRMSPQHVTSLWPIIISEMVQVFLHIEQELSTDTEEFSLSTLSLPARPCYKLVDQSPVSRLHLTWFPLGLTSGGDQIAQASGYTTWQYRWAFVGNAEPTHLNNNRTQEETPQTPDFVPHVVRIAKLMDNKFAGSVEAPVRVPGQLLLVVSSIRSLQELHPFFTAMSTHSTASALSDSLQGRTGGLLDIEAIVERDFLERLPAR
uniref:Protein dopey-1 homolog n=1 Tax=Timema tahoe TaxID=61484 RepID=A0A7R9FPF7_9NEOP|nr:unnamed protein product [Timema tahoe]